MCSKWNMHKPTQTSVIVDFGKHHVETVLQTDSDSGSGLLALRAAQVCSGTDVNVLPTCEHQE